MILGMFDQSASRTTLFWLFKIQRLKFLKFMEIGRYFALWRLLPVFKTHYALIGIGQSFPNP